jgi:hypothetical protein
MQIESDTTPVTPQPGRYEIDTARSRVSVRTRHLFGLAPVTAAPGLAGRRLELSVEVQCQRK